MMLALYVLLAWSMIGGIAAVLMGRAIAACASREQDEQALAQALRPTRSATVQSLDARKVA
jgi:hypothetical protein